MSKSDRPEEYLAWWEERYSLLPADDQWPLLTVIVPVYNEEATIDQVLRSVEAVRCEKQIIVVDDGSTDGTAKTLDGWHGRQNIVLLRHAENRGKGAAIRTALEYARGPITIVQDGDLESDPEDFLVVLPPLINGQAQAVYGSRYLSDKCAGGVSRLGFRGGVMLLNLMVRVLYGVRITDEATCYKLFPTEVLRMMDLRCERFEFCPEVTAKACRLGLRILEVPIHYRPRTSKSGKKLRLVDGVQALATLWKWRKWKPSKAVDRTAFKLKVEQLTTHQ